MRDYLDPSKVRRASSGAAMPNICEALARVCSTRRDVQEIAAPHLKTIYNWHVYQGNNTIGLDDKDSATRTATSVTTAPSVATAATPSVTTASMTTPTSFTSCRRLSPIRLSPPVGIQALSLLPNHGETCITCQDTDFENTNAVEDRSHGRCPIPLIARAVTVLLKSLSRITGLVVALVDKPPKTIRVQQRALKELKLIEEFFGCEYRPCDHIRYYVD
ncbi:hypothetical protein GNI_180870 [Gregarina niphandrodes]|uniref:Uncharacterized protein n=1 Tax=Gregarina niphandrodes TaxID=110365 RepID=A0A023AWZ1_GRENI|nr:hypothetical protein GNI_180870 [Gregarina niphandrodes]EZG43234.1 hypothetical protein GNI_180870 [Gregarina niphandrodes]|eukprot:XP_011133502.1 hypothetical protein GNI_180870 [Gregarina niphandrodes]